MRFSRASALLAGLQTVIFPTAALAQDGGAYNTVSLDGYGSFSGTVVNSTQSGRTLPAPVDAWLGIDYSTQPVGDGRFRPVTWPASFDGVKPAVKFGKSCVQGPPGTIPAGEEDEACLNFNVFRTQGVPLDQKTPVLVWIHGGSFFLGSYRSFDAAAFAASSKVPITVVNFHYRLNSLGFLPSTLFEEEGLLNLGLRDQNFFLQFVQKHIASFGGDPDAVTIGGRSAGGHSVGIHYFHNYGDGAGRKLFRGAIHQSGSVTARAFPNSTYPLYVRQFDEYMQFLGCPQDAGNAAALACLRAADIAKIRAISSKIYLQGDGPLTWPFQPTAGGPLLEKFGSQSGYDGTFHHVPTITSTTTNEGKFYVPGNLETNQQFLDFLHNISPVLNAADLQLLQACTPTRRRTRTRRSATRPTARSTSASPPPGATTRTSARARRRPTGRPRPACPSGSCGSTRQTSTRSGKGSRTRPTPATRGTSPRRSTLTYRTYTTPTWPASSPRATPTFTGGPGLPSGPVINRRAMASTRSRQSSSSFAPRVAPRLKRTISAARRVCTGAVPKGRLV
ncbi:para-nitrobenzyl esterase [Magnaporthiopsis poae ATCC 64411]|uniref:Carboxylic ester hydrolase n=1 Tax=Magnaporthiopsis poae (strain ATCC 64411 / 73-15) TaxID=644358 RepID=A0A0C4DW53_MAGP6|nr:para-nitrobenzyl esterase [Magnaporthiopsis poae ATCC 64411]